MQRERNRSTARCAALERTGVRRVQATFPPVERAMSSSPTAFPIRLRYLVLLLAAGLSLRSFGLRAVAYWQLHETATGLANYGSCMAGPTGPELIQRRPAEFWRLVRRRLVASDAEARPFAACGPELESFGQGTRRAAHEARASEFIEYGARPGESKAPSVADLTVSSARVTELQRAAWPFAPADLDALVRPERSAKVSPHPMEPARPALGRGLPSMELGYSSVRASGSSYLLVAGQGANASAHRSEDGGTTWADVDVPDMATSASAGGCSSGEGRTSFRLRETGDQLRVDSWLNGELETSFALGSAESRLLGFACDANAALAITSSSADGRPTFRLCPHRAPCKSLAVPPALRASTGASLSIARVKNVSVISIARGGVVRVISSRDDGQTWTPPVVAYDREDPGGTVIPTHLLGLGSKLVLYAGGRSPTDVYPSLVSSDFGASWQGR
jgi:hypothetical protein